MAAAQVLALGLLIVHAAWLWFWLCGSLALPPVRGAQTNAAALLDVVLSTAAGIAITGLVTFALGLAHALVPAAALLALPAAAVAFVLRGDSPFRRTFWSVRLTQLCRAATPGALIVWMLAVFLAPPALVPDNGSDATAFYLPQAFDYARSHYLVVDLWYRYPWYPNNWTLILTWPHVLGLARYVQFLNWLTGALALLGVYGLIAWTETRESDPGPRASWLGIAATLTLATQPIFGRFLALNMLDVPTGTFFLMCAAATMVAVRERTSRTLAALVLCGGFLVGVKISYILLLPLFCGFVAIIVARAGAPRRVGAVALMLLILVSAPWYVRAFVLTGDPVEPVLNLRFTGEDPKNSKTDLQGQLADLRGDNSPAALLRLPLVLFADPASRESRDVGVSALVFCLPLPALYLGWAFVTRRLLPTPMTSAAVALVYTYAYWNLTSHLERYSLMFMPLLAVLVGILAVMLARRTAWLRYAVFGIVPLLAIPSPAAIPYYTIIWDLYYKNVGAYYTTANVWLEYRAPAYPQLEDVAHLLRRSKTPERFVYIYQLGGDMYFAHQLGLELIGDVFGPGRFSDLGRAVEYGILPQWLERFHVRVLIAAQSQLDGDPVIAGLELSLRELGWRKYRYAASDWVVFVSPKLPQLVIGEGHPPGSPEGRPAPASGVDPHDAGVRS